MHHLDHANGNASIHQSTDADPDAGPARRGVDETKNNSKSLSKIPPISREAMIADALNAR